MQIERGTVKFSKRATEFQAAGTSLVETAVKHGYNSTRFNELKDSLSEDVFKLLEKTGVFVMFDEGKTGFKQQLKDFNTPKSLQKSVDTYFETNTNKQSTASMEQFADFSKAFIELLPPELLKVLPDEMFRIN